MSLQLDQTRPRVPAFVDLVTAIEKALAVTTNSTLELELRIPRQRPGYWKCNVRNYDTGEDITADPSEVLTGPHDVRGIIQCTSVLRHRGGDRVATWVAKSLEYRRALPDAVAAPPCNE